MVRIDEHVVLIETLELIGIFLLVAFAVAIWSKHWTRYTGFVTTAIMFVLCCALWYYYNYGFVEGSVTKFAVEFFAVLFSGVSIIFVIETLYLQKKQLKDSNDIAARTYDAEVMRIIDEFFSPELADCRNTCGTLREKLIYDKETTVKNLKFAFERQILDDYNACQEWRDFKKTVAYKEYAAFTRLIRYFDLISFYHLSERTSQAVHFYYVWWRSFFYEVKEIFISVNNSIPANKRQLSFLPNWVFALERLDNELRKYNLPLK